MIYTMDEIKQIIFPIAEKHHLRTVYLFGSYAKGTATEHSDIDLLIDTTGTNIRTLLQLAEVYCDLEEALGKRVDVIPLTSITQRIQMPSENSFRENIWNERVTLYDAA